MKLSDIKDYNYTPDKFEFTNFFDVVEKQSENGNVITFFNLNEGVTIEGIDDIRKASVKEHICRNGDNLRFISYKYYGTISYWWLIAKVNNISDCFEKLEAGRKIYILSKEHMNYIFNLISNRESSE